MPKNNTCLTEILELAPHNEAFNDEITQLKRDYIQEETHIKKCKGDYFLMLGHIRKKLEIEKKINELAGINESVYQ